MYQDDGKNIMFTKTIHTEKEKREQEKIWEEVIRQMRSDLNNMFRRVREI